MRLILLDYGKSGFRFTIRPLRMTKVQQKISGCFRSFHRSEIFCRVSRYLSSMQKQEIDAGEALKVLFSEKWADFAKSQFSLEELT